MRSLCLGVLCFNDLVALGVMSACAENGPQVGKDILIVGIDDIEDGRDSFPSLTSISCNISGLADETATRMLEWIKLGQAPEDVARLPVELVKRASSG